MINETEIEAPASSSPIEKLQMERAREHEEDTLSEERDQYRRAPKEPTSQRNEEPVVGTLSNQRPYPTRRNQKEQPTRPTEEQVGRIKEGDHLGFEGNESDTTVNQIYNPD